MAIGVFDVAVSGDDEQRMLKQAERDKLNAAIYDVRERHGTWLFGARDIDGFNDRAKLAHVSICQTIEPHLHARTGVHRRVMKALEREWRQKQAAHVPKNRETETAAHDTEAQTPEFWDAVRHHQEQGYHPDAAYSRAFAQHGIAIPELPDATALRNQYGLHEDPEVARWQNYESSRRQAADYESPYDPSDDAWNHEQRRHEVENVWPYLPGGEQYHNRQNRPNPPSPHQAAITEDTMANTIDSGLSNAAAGPKGMKAPRMPHEHVQGPQLVGRRHYADGPSVQGRMGSPGLAPAPTVDQPIGPYHDGFDAHQHMDSNYGENTPMGPTMPNMAMVGYRQATPMGAGDLNPSQPPNPTNWQDGSMVGEEHLLNNYSGPKAMTGHRLACYPGCHENEAHAKKFHKDKEKESRRHQAADDHPEMHNQVTFSDHQGEELIPDGNFEGYKDSVDQGAPSKVNHDFVPGAHDHEYHADQGHNFDPGYHHASEYNRIAQMLYGGPGDDQGAGAPPGMPAMPPSSDMGGGATLGADPGTPAAQPIAPATAPSVGSPAGVTPPAMPGMTASREYQIIARMIQAEIPGMAPAPEVPFDPVQPGPSFGQGAPEGGAGSRGKSFSNVPSIGDFGVAGAAGQDANTRAGSRHYADRNYLQQADEALTKVLNEKAEEFQNTIAPLQAALQTIQQAEALTNPLNVSPPAGTVNVLPQQEGAQAPQGGGGLGADPAAAGLAAQPQQQVARRRHPLGH